MCYVQGMNTAIVTDRDGFPVATCGRCTGTGRYPSSAWNGVCLECNGPGMVFPTKAVRALADQWRNEFHLMSHVAPAATLTIGHDDAITRTPPPVNPGDRIRTGNQPYRTVTAVRPTARICGSGYVGPEGNQRLVALTLLTVITFDDGTTAEAFGNEWDRDYDWAAAVARRVELAAAAVASYEKYLAGAPARSAASAKRAAKRAEERAAKAAVRAAEEAARADAEATVWAATVTANPELADLAGARYAEAEGFAGSMRDRYLAKAMTEKQIAAAVELVRRDRAQAGAHAALLESGVTAPTGRVTVTGTVTAAWMKDTDYGTAYKMRVETADGWTVAGTIPKALDGTLEEMRGRTVTLLATITPDKSDRTHGWYSHPTKATWTDAATVAA